LASTNILHYGTVDSVVGTKIYVRSSVIGGGSIAFPVEGPGYDLFPGDRVILGRIGSVKEDLIIVTPVDLLRRRLSVEWHFGDTDPAPELGADGDFYLNTTSGDLFQKNIDVWELIGNLQGPAGASSWDDITDKPTEFPPEAHTHPDTDIILVSDSYGPSWDGDETTIPTKDALYDKIESILVSGGYGNEDAQDAVGGILVDTSTVDLSYHDGVPSITADVLDSPKLDGHSSPYFLDRSNHTGTQPASTIVVTDDPYGAGWNGSTDIPTKNALYDKIETLSGGGSYNDEQAQDAVGTILTDTSTVDFAYNDAAPSITATVLDSPTLQGHNSAYHLDRANHTGTQTASTVSDFNEAAQDAIGLMVTDTSTADITYTDATPALKVDVLDSPTLQGQNGAYYLNRTNHTGTQTAATISNFNTAADARVAAAVGVTVQAYDVVLDYMSALTAANNKLPFFNGTSTMNTTDFTSEARQLLDDTSFSAMRSTLGLAIGADVQAFDSDLSTLAAAFVSATTTVGANLAFNEGTLNGLNKIIITAPASIGSNQTLTLPEATDTLVGKATTDTFTNKTFNANGTGNSITNIEVADFASGVVDTDLSSVSGSDDTVPSAKATKTALDLKAPLASPAFTGTPIVPDDPYGAGWDGSTGIPTKNAIYDKIQTLGGGGYTDEQAQDAVGSILTDTATVDFTYNDAANTITAAVLDSPTLQGQNGAYYLSRANHTGTQLSSTISDFTEASQDSVGAMVANTSTANVTYTDATPELKVDVVDSPTLQGNNSAYHLSRANHTGTQTASTISDFTEAAQDAIGGALTDTATVDLTYDDAGNTISAAVLDSPTLQGQNSAYHLSRANHTGTQLASTISDFNEAAQDAVGGILTDTATLDFTYDDAGNTISAAVLDSPTLQGQNSAYHLSRTNHTGTQLASTISNFNSAADARIAAAVGVSVQAYDIELDALATTTSAADKVPYFTGSGTATTATLTSTGRSLIDDTSIQAMRKTLGIDTLLPGAASQGLIAVSYDTTAIAGNSLPTTGSVYLTKFTLWSDATITNLHVQIETAGSTLTTNQCYAALYDSTGTRQGLTASQHLLWASTGAKTIALTTPYAAAAGEYWVAILVNGTTAPAFARSVAAANAQRVNAFLSNATSKAGIAATSQTSMPSSFTPSSISQTAHHFWVGVS
jgi:hypothetical protein